MAPEERSAEPSPDLHCTDLSTQLAKHLSAEVILNSFKFSIANTLSVPTMTAQSRDEGKPRGRNYPLCITAGLWAPKMGSLAPALRLLLACVFRQTA